ncbi:MAG: hypothetical protein JG767_1160 [Deferribacteraceae bacterium]|jgi:uncharacterized protein (DUF362 family)|nr:hypothetical protein [Deferribacteraceae bacterium]
MNKVYIREINSYAHADLEIFIKNFFLEYFDAFKNVRKILLKPNILQASIPERGVTTHPDFIRVVIKALREIGNFEILLGDSPGANFKNYDKVLKITGIKKVCEDERVKIVKIENFKPLLIDDTIISSIINDVDLIINLPKLKTHSLTGLTLAVKNLFGLVPGTNKVNFHRKNPVDEKLADAIFKVYDIVKNKCIHILDGIIAHEGDGPSRGSPVALNFVAASDNAVCLDMAVCDILGLGRGFCLTNKSALKNDDVYKFTITGDKISRKIKIPLSRKSLKVPNFLKKFVANNIYVKPEVNKKCIGCLLCLNSCPVYAIKKSDDGKVIIDKKACIECFCCHEVCESGAIDLKRSFFHRVIVND